MYDENNAYIGETAPITLIGYRQGLDAEIPSRTMAFTNLIDSKDKGIIERDNKIYKVEEQTYLMEYLNFDLSKDNLYKGWIEGVDFDYVSTEILTSEYPTLRLPIVTHVINKYTDITDENEPTYIPEFPYEMADAPTLINAEINKNTDFLILKNAEQATEVYEMTYNHVHTIPNDVINPQIREMFENTNGAVRFVLFYLDEDMYIIAKFLPFTKDMNIPQDVIDKYQIVEGDEIWHISDEEKQKMKDYTEKHGMQEEYGGFFPVEINGIYPTVARFDVRDPQVAHELIVPSEISKPITLTITAKDKHLQNGKLNISLNDAPFEQQRIVTTKIDDIQTFTTKLSDFHLTVDKVSYFVEDSFGNKSAIQTVELPEVTIKPIYLTEHNQLITNDFVQIGSVTETAIELTDDGKELMPTFSYHMQENELYDNNSRTIYRIQKLPKYTYNTSEKIAKLTSQETQAVYYLSEDRTVLLDATHAPIGNIKDAYFMYNPSTILGYMEAITPKPETNPTPETNPK